MSQVPAKAPEQLSMWETQQPLDYIAIKRELENQKFKYESVLNEYANFVVGTFCQDMKLISAAYHNGMFVSSMSFSDDLKKIIQKKISIPVMLEGTKKC